MRLAVPRDPHAASWPRRAAAPTIDMALIATAGGAFSGAALGIRRVDARTRGPVSVRSAYIALLVQTSSCTWMLPQMLVHVAIERLPSLGSTTRQTLTERLTGTVVVLAR